MGGRGAVGPGRAGPAHPSELAQAARVVLAGAVGLHVAPLPRALRLVLRPLRRVPPRRLLLLARRLRPPRRVALRPRRAQAVEPLVQRAAPRRQRLRLRLRRGPLARRGLGPLQGREPLPQQVLPRLRPRRLPAPRPSALSVCPFFSLTISLTISFSPPLTSPPKIPSPLTPISLDAAS